MAPRLAIIGLDCAPPELVFDAWRGDLPHLRGLMEKGIHAPLVSTTPPITVPAWTAMMTSQDPGMLGVYGFRNRQDHSYHALYYANATSVKARTVWAHLTNNGLSSLVMGVPQTYPPRPLNGAMVSCFLTPDKAANYTFPAGLKRELDEAADGDYIIDVRNFRTQDKDRLLEEIHVMTRRRFKAFRHLLRTRKFDFAVMVEMGTDRIHHAFWRHFDKSHRLYEPGNRFENAIHEYYVAVDEEIGLTLAELGDDTSAMVVSDHGAKGMKGAFCINEWLRQEGYLALNSEPDAPAALDSGMVDWPNTRAWGEGGYYARIFLNVEGREPQGRVSMEKYEEIRDELAAKLRLIRDEKGGPIGATVFKPEETYRACNGVPPDLIVYVGDLTWRAAALVGTGHACQYENDTGPDDANHAEKGILIWDPPKGSRPRMAEEYSIYDIAPSILKAYEIEPGPEMIGQSII